ncbi:MAG: APC family permease [Clostridiales Family XIII bacterium]|jgi:amino acid transporter|nr:APC family permease [Clostridiales Family XIII bacterium]
MGEVAKKRERHGAKDVITKRVGVLSVVGMFYAMCCAGAYGIEEMIPEVGPGLTVVMLVVLPFVWALPYSYICAELGSARPVEGGNIMWVKEALGEFWFGIMVFVNFIWGLVANTVYVVLAVSYFGTMIELTSIQAYVLKVGLILIFFVVNVLGIKEVSFVSTVLSVAVMAVFLLVAVVGFAHMDSNPMIPFMSDEYDGNVFMTIGAGLAIGIWMYSGFDEISLVAGEIKESHKIIPKALMIVIPLMILTYVLPTIAGLGSVGQWELWTTEPDGIGYHTVLSQFAPKIFSVIFVFVAIIGQCAIYNMCVAVAARSSMILADEHFGPRGLAKLSNSRGTPVISLIVVIIVTTALLGTPNHPLEFTFLVVLDVFFSVFVCALTVISAVILKRRIPADEVPFKAPGGKTGHNIMAGLCLFFCVAIVLLNGTDYFLGGYLVMLLIPIIYVACKWIWKGTTVKEPELYPIDSRTKLGFGDVTKIGGYFLCFGLFGIIARYFLQWYESDWGPDYYIEEYESGMFSNFYSMLNMITLVGIIALVIGIVIFAVGRKLR